MSKVRGAVQGINVPAKIAACVATAAFFANQIMVRPLLADTLDNQLLGSPISLRDQIGVAFVFDGNFAEK